MCNHLAYTVFSQGDCQTTVSVGKRTYSGVALVILMCSTVTTDRFRIRFTMESILNK